MKKIIKNMMMFFLALVAIVIAGYFIVVNVYPSFGGKMSKERLANYQQSSQLQQGKFINPNNATVQLSAGQMVKYFTEKAVNGSPQKDLNVVELDSTKVANYNADARLIWYGHSAFLLQMEGKHLLIDPMFGNYASPFPVGARRFNTQLPLSIAKLPQIDAVIISHDHYDHLDYSSIQQLKEKVNHYFVPLGVGIHLEAWGVQPNQITELDWWQSAELGNVNLVCTPAQHFSGRKVGNKPSTLWSSWVIQSPNENLFFSGDGGYASHFKEIGNKYGPFDLALMECGQYNEMWKEIHCMPEEAAQAGADVQAKKIMPIHWAGFKLAKHDWVEPILRVKKKADELQLPVVAPQIGEEVIINTNDIVYSTWWEKYQ